MEGGKDGGIEQRGRRGGKSKRNKKKETCDVGGMAVVSAGIGEIGITGIMGEEGGAASAC